MRRTWIAIAMIVSLVAIAASYRIGRSGRPRPEAASPEQPSARAVDPAPPEVAPVVPRPRPEDEAGHETPSEGEAVDEPTNPTVPSMRAAGQVPAVIDNAPSSFSSVPGGKPSAQATFPTPSSIPPTVPAPIPPPIPPTIPSQSSTEPKTQEPTKETDTAPSPDDPESDRRPPELQNLRFDPQEIKDGGTTTLYVGSTDDLSGVKTVYGAIRSPSGAALLPFSARDVSGGMFSATIAIPARGETGDWFVANLHIIDKAENNLTLAFARATVPVGGALRVVSDESDSQAPEVRRVSVLKNSVDAGERNQIVVEVEDPSGVAQVSGAFQSPSKSAFVPFNCAHAGESPSWEGDIPIPENADCGEWTLRQLRVVDKANNSAFLSMDSPQVGRVSFLVSGGGACDAEPPVVDAMYFQPTAVSNETASEVVVTVQAHDDRSGVATVSGWIDGPVATNGQAPRIYFECRADPNDNGAPMTSRITVPQYAAKGLWRVTLAQVTDKARNTRAYNRNDPALGDASFTVD